MPKKANLFYNNFIGQFVFIYTKNKVFLGYIIDIDDKFCYIGETLNQISGLIKIDIIQSIIISKPEIVLQDDEKIN